MIMLEYSEFKNLMNTLEQSNKDNTYQELMQKEENVLNNVNEIVKNYRDDKFEDKQFVHLSIHEIFHRIFTEIPIIMMEFYTLKDIKDVFKIFTKNDRLVFIGIILIGMALFLFFIEISK